MLLVTITPEEYARLKKHADAVERLNCHDTLGDEYQLAGVVMDIVKRIELSHSNWSGVISALLTEKSS